MLPLAGCGLLPTKAPLAKISAHARKHLHVWLASIAGNFPGSIGLAQPLTIQLVDRPGDSLTAENHKPFDILGVLDARIGNPRALSLPGTREAWAVQ